MAKVVVLLSPTQRTKLVQIPGTFSEREITRYYSLSTDDLAVIEQHRRPQNRLGFTVQLAYLRFPGRPWDPQEQVPPAILIYLAEQIGNHQTCWPTMPYATQHAVSISPKSSASSVFTPLPCRPTAISRAG